MTSRSVRPRELQKLNKNLFFSQADTVPYTLVLPDRGLYFPSVDAIRTALLVQNSEEEEKDLGMPAPVIVDMSRVVAIDYTAAAVRIREHRFGWAINSILGTNFFFHKSQLSTNFVIGLVAFIF